MSFPSYDHQNIPGINSMILLSVLKNLHGPSLESQMSMFRNKTHKYSVIYTKVTSILLQHNGSQTRTGLKVTQAIVCKG